MDSKGGPNTSPLKRLLPSCWSQTTASYASRSFCFSISMRRWVTEVKAVSLRLIDSSRCGHTASEWTRAVVRLNFLPPVMPVHSYSNPQFSIARTVSLSQFPRADFLTLSSSQDQPHQPPLDTSSLPSPASQSQQEFP